MKKTQGEIGGPVESQLILGDSSEKLKDIPDNSIDLVSTDPPY
jgi:DNA modification methylase